MRKPDALSGRLPEPLPEPLLDLCTREGGEAPPDAAADVGWDRLQAALWPGPGGDGGDAPSGDPGGDPGGTATPAAASSPASAGAASLATKIAAGLALATTIGVGLATWPDGHDDAPSPRAASARTPPASAARPEAPRAAPDRIAGVAEPGLARDDAARSDAPRPDEVQGSTGEVEPPPRPSEPRPEATLPDVPGEGLAHEVAILREASAALAAGKPATALRWTRRHAADHPSGSLTEERLATDAIARCMLHDRRAAKAAESFLRRYPRSTHEGRVRAACETIEP